MLAICLHFISQTLQIRGTHFDDVIVQVTLHRFISDFRRTTNNNSLQVLFTQDIYVFPLPLFLSWSNKTVLYQPLPLVLIWALRLNNKKQWQLILISCLNITAPSYREESIMEWKH